MRPFTLVAYGPAKTGNTSLTAHAQAHLGQAEHYQYGPHNATRRLYAGMPLLEEFNADELAQLRLVHGHGVAFSTLAALPDNDIALYLVCRHPVDRFVSSYKHYLRHRRQGVMLDARAYFERQAPSPIASAVLARFAPLAALEAASEEDRLVSILQCMRFILATELLNEMSVELFSCIGIPPLDSRRRVQDEAADLGDLTAEEIRSRDWLDLMVFEAVTSAWKSRSLPTGQHNPFGYRSDRLAAARRRLAGTENHQQELVERAYFDLFDFHQADGRLHATKVFLGVSGRRAARDAFAVYCAKRSPDLRLADLPVRNWCFLADAYGLVGDARAQRDALEAALALERDNPRANFSMGRLAAKSRETDLAVRYLSTAVELNPVMQEAWSWLARMHLKRRDPVAAADAINRALALNPTSEKLRELHDVITSKHSRDLVPD
jgi:tetratricopeptide (TPR) repeat protein